MGKARSGACSKDIKFGSSQKAQCFISAKMGRKEVESVGGINGVLGCRFKKVGLGTAKKLACKMQEMTKRNYLRYMMKETGSNVRYAMDSYVSMKKHCEQMEDCKCGKGKGRKGKGSKARRCP